MVRKAKEKWVRIGRLGLVVVLLGWLIAPARGQFEGPADTLVMTGEWATTWRDGGTSIVQLQGPVRIAIDKNILTGDNAVVWLTRMQGAVADEWRAEVALLGNARLEQPNGITRSGQRLFVDAMVRGRIGLTAHRGGGNQAESELYKSALSMRPVALRGGQPSGRWVMAGEEPPPGPATQPAERIRALEPVRISTDSLLTQTAEGKVVAILSGKIILIQRKANGDFLELMADRAVLFTPLTTLTELQATKKIETVEEAVTGAYLEGDVRINSKPGDPKESEQRLTANRAYYDFTTDRAVLTDVVVHTSDPKSKIPIIIRAGMVRQLSEGEFEARHARLSTSSFHTPSYSIGASSAYVRRVETGNEVLGARTTFHAEDATFRIGPAPVLYLPGVAGFFTQRNVLRNIETSSSSGFGFGASTEWGLFESFNRLPPRGTDASYKVDYFAERGPATGVDVSYSGGYIDETTLNPWSYSGDFTSYLVLDEGKDELGRRRLDVEPDDEMRGRFHWQHQHFFPDDWHVQLTGGYISDATFMEEWFNREFRAGRPLDTSLYIKRQRDTEAFYWLSSVQPNDFATVSELYQEQFEIDRYAEIGYRRIGDSWWDDRATFFSANTLSALRFDPSDESLADLGFRPADVGRFSPGIPAIGQTGTPDDTTYRGDFRQEINFPFTLGEFRAVPYVVGRYTAYSDSPDGGSRDRAYAAGGLRLTTAFWSVDDSVESRLFDLRRLRHVIEPEANIYAAAQSTDRRELLIYDESIDNITDVSAVRVALNQRWQTKRGGPGRWRSVDFLTLNLAGNFFFNQPPDEELNPLGFRGLHFVSMPEASIPRNGLSMDLAWRVSDQVTVQSDAQYNMDEDELATASVGFRVRQDERVSYFLGFRHIGLDFEQVIGGNTFLFEDRDLAIFALDYQLTTNYRVALANSYDLAHSRNTRSTATLVRQFDRFFASVSVRVDQIEGENAIFFNVWPEGLSPGKGSSAAGIFD